MALGKPTLLRDFANSRQLGPADIFTRASVKTRTNWPGLQIGVPANRAAFDFDPTTLASKGLLLEGQQANGVRNNTMVGTVAGSPGTIPNNWLQSGGAGITRTVIGTGIELGVPYIDVQFVQPANGASAVTLLSELTNIVLATVGQTWTYSHYVRLVGGSLTNLTIQTQFREYNAGGTATSFLSSAFVPTTNPLITQRASFTRQLTTSDVASVDCGLAVTSSGAFSVTLRIGAPQSEQNSFASSLILTTSAAVTRSPDGLDIPISGWFNTIQGCLVATITFLRPIGVGGPDVIFDINRALSSSDNRIVLYRSSDGYITYVVTDAGGIGVPIASTTPINANTRIRVAVRYQPGQQSMLVSGQGILNASKSSSSFTVDTMRLARDVANVSPTNGWLSSLVAFSGYPTDAEFSKLVVL